ncbi:MAG: MerC domain-containing protein [Ginsengibacter sp.]
MNTRINWDFFGMLTSIACAVHCAILPLVISSLPVLGVNIINNSPFEWLMIGIAFVVGSVAVLHGYRSHHKSFVPFYLFCVGFIFLLVKQFFHSMELVFLLPAVFFILFAHVLNYKYCRQAKQSKTLNKLTISAV